MTPARWQQIDELFQQVMDLGEAERIAILDASCREDAELRREIESLIASSADAAPTLREMIEHEAETMAGAEVAAQLGRRIGAYQLVELLGEGGMGIVYRAVADDGRAVAIKILRTGLASAQAIARFSDERQILARLDHPSIVRLLDGGTTDDLPYLVMEHLAGVSITRHARDHALSVRDRVQLIASVCDAVAYAHALKIVHRDLKPSNILVGGDGVPKLLDFGIAKLLDATEPRAAMTMRGATPLTFEYASPEQLRGEVISTASDIYSLGAVLFELVAERPPHVGSTVDMVRVVSQCDAPRASTVAPAERRPTIAGELDDILARALSREVSRRQTSIAALGDDLRRYLR